MLRVGLTGGIGSGKSSVARLLTDRGAFVIDGDRVAREVVEPGMPILAEIVREFGPGMLTPDGSLDRAGLAAVVFPDPDRLAALNRIMHPVIAARVAELTELAHRRGDRLVIHDMPLIVERGGEAEYDLLIVVTAPEEVRVARLVRRGLDEADARARIARQAPEWRLVAAADLVVRNDGDEDALAAEVSRVWEAIGLRADQSDADVRPTD